MDKTRGNTSIAYPSGTTSSDNYPIKQETCNVPITMPTPNNSSYFLEIADATKRDIVSLSENAKVYIVHQCIGFISVDKYYFSSLKEAVTFIQEKGGIK